MAFDSRRYTKVSLNIMFFSQLSLFVELELVQYVAVGESTKIPLKTWLLAIRDKHWRFHCVRHDDPREFIFRNVDSFCVQVYASEKNAIR